MTAFARGKHAPGICDRCGLQFKLRKLRTESVRGKPTKALVCGDCWDEDHPQNFVGSVPVRDPQALRNPRPDPALAASRRIPNQPGSAVSTEVLTPLSTDDATITIE